MASAIRVIADSVCDVPPDLVEALQITLVPAVVNIGDRSYLDDGVELTRDEFYEMMPRLPKLPTTSACPLGLCREKIAQQAANAEHLILISTPAHLSSIHNNFRIAAEELVPGRYTLIDSGQVTMGEGFQVIAAAEMARDGHPVAEIVAALDVMRPKIHVFGALNTLDNLYKSGRVGWVTAMAGRLLRIKPVVELTEGIVTSIDNVRAFKRAYDRLMGLAQQYAPYERLAVLHTNNAGMAAQFRSALAHLFPVEKILVVNVNPPLGTHVGAQGLGLAMVTANR